VLALLAFILAFTFSMAAGRFDTRKALLLEEVNAIGTAALRADLLPEPYRSQCRELLGQYVDIRVSAARDPQQLPSALAESEKLHGQMWARARDLARADMNSDIGALFVESLNQVIDLHTSRVTVALRYRVPTAIWFVLGGLTFLGMAGVGYHFGILGRSSFTIYVILGLSFALVVTLIADLDRVTTSIMQVNQQPMLELQRQLSRSAGDGVQASEDGERNERR
jgi:hypothetical protein